MKLLFITLLSISLCSCGQANSTTKNNLNAEQDSIAYLQKCVEFIKQIEQKELSDTNFILADKPFSFEDFDCIKELLTDTTIYTKDELLLIRNKTKPLLTKWTKEFFTNTKIVNSDTISSIFKDNSKWWPYFYKNIGRSFNTFSVPIFFRNDTYCLFYSDHHCGGLCGGGRLTLYKKENNKWTEIKSYCDWVS